jgi:ribose transport system permease protein
MGVLIFALLANGMNLVGLSFFWQGLARGAALLLVLLLGVLLNGRRPAFKQTIRPPAPAFPRGKTPRA